MSLNRPNKGRNGRGDGWKDRERVSGHKSGYDQPAVQHSTESMNKTGQIDGWIAQDG